METNHLSINKFHKLKNGLYGYHPTCKLCRSEMRKRKNIQVELTSKKCSSCHKEINVMNFYKNKNSNDGLQSYCKKCHKIKISESNSKLDKFCKIILDKFKKKNKDKIINIDYKDLVKKYKEQNKACFVTGHIMTHKSDIKQRTDNIWNLSIFLDKNVILLVFSSSREARLFTEFSGELSCIISPRVRVQEVSSLQRR